MQTAESRPHIKTRVSDLIGGAPLLELPVAPGSGRVLLKLEQFNPTGTAKIRMARQMVDEAEAQGKLKPGGWIVESTSGNTGLGLALIAAERGYRFTAVVDHHSSTDKLRGMQAYGAELIRVGSPDGDWRLRIGMPLPHALRPSMALTGRNSTTIRAMRTATRVWPTNSGKCSATICIFYSVPLAPAAPCAERAERSRRTFPTSK